MALPAREDGRTHHRRQDRDGGSPARPTCVPPSSSRCSRTSGPYGADCDHSGRPARGPTTPLAAALLAVRGGRTPAAVRALAPGVARRRARRACSSPSPTPPATSTRSGTARSRKADELRAGFRAAARRPARRVRARREHARPGPALPVGDGAAARPRLVTTDGEFHTLRRQLARLEEEGVEVVRVPLDPVTRSPSASPAEVDDRTAAVLVSAVLFETAAAGAGPRAPRRRLPRPVDRARRRRLPRAGRGAVRAARPRATNAWVLGGGYKYLQLGEGNCFLRLPAHAQELRPVITGWYAEFGALADERRPGAGRLRHRRRPLRRRHLRPGQPLPRRPGPAVLRRAGAHAGVPARGVAAPGGPARVACSTSSACPRTSSPATARRRSGCSAGSSRCAAPTPAGAAGGAGRPRRPHRQPRAVPALRPGAVPLGHPAGDGDEHARRGGRAAELPVRIAGPAAGPGVAERSEVGAGHLQRTTSAPGFPPTREARPGHEPGAGDKGVTTVTEGVFARGTGHEQVVFCHDQASGLQAIIGDLLHRARPRARRHPLPPLRRPKPTRSTTSSRLSKGDGVQERAGRARPRRRQGRDHRRPATRQVRSAAAGVRALRGVPGRPLHHRVRRRHVRADMDVVARESRLRHRPFARGTAAPATRPCSPPSASSRACGPAAEHLLGQPGRWPASGSASPASARSARTWSATSSRTARWS